MTRPSLPDLLICIKGAGEMATGIACRLYRCHLRRIVLLETAEPLAVRRRVAMCEALFHGEKTVEGVPAVRASGITDVEDAWRAGRVPLLVDPEWRSIPLLRPDVLVDAIIAKRNPGTHITDAALVIGLGPGFTAGADVHRVVETNRGHHLGRVIVSGCAEPNTGVPGLIGGYRAERVLKAPATGRFTALCRIGDRVRAGDRIGDVAGEPVIAAIDGILRGVIRDGTTVPTGLKLGDIDPRGSPDHCHTVSDKARALAGGVLEAILERFNG